MYVALTPEWGELKVKFKEGITLKADDFWRVLKIKAIKLK